MKGPHSTHLSSPCTDNDDEDEEDSDGEDDDDDQTAPVQSRKENGQALNNSNNKDLVVEDLDELNRLYIRRGEEEDDNGDQSDEKPIKKKKRKKGMKNGNMHGHRHPKLKHWEKMALDQSHQQSCNCRHHVMRLAADQVVYDWCRCKDHQHKEVFEKQKQATPPPEPPREATPPPPPRPKPKPKPRKVHQKSVGVDATEPATTELALAYDPSAVDYDMIQEAIYYRTSSGRLVIHIYLFNKESSLFSRYSSIFV